MQADKPQSTIRRGKLVVDVEKRTFQCSDLSADDEAAMAADRSARVAGLRRRWEEAGDLQALLGALIFYQQQLPEWLFKGLMQSLEQQFKNPDAIRFLAVRYAHDVLGMTMDESYDWACDNIDDPAARGGRDSMMKSYQKVRSQAAQLDRIRPRRRTRSRRGSTK
jgi:hypothetical protein